MARVATGPVNRESKANNAGEGPMSPRVIFLAGIALYAIWGMKTVARKPQEPNQAASYGKLPDGAAVDIAEEHVPSHWNGTRRAVRLPRTTSSSL
jgi:hypothetical protein